MSPCPTTFLFVYFSIDAIFVQEDQLHTAVHLIWRASVTIRYLSFPHSVTVVTLTYSHALMRLHSYVSLCTLSKPQPFALSSLLSILVYYLFFSPLPYGAVRYSYITCNVVSSFSPVNSKPSNRLSGSSVSVLLPTGHKTTFATDAASSLEGVQQQFKKLKW